MAELWKGAREFLAAVFAHRDKRRDQFIASFRGKPLRERADFTSLLPAQSPRHLFEQRNTRQ